MWLPYWPAERRTRTAPPERPPAGALALTVRAAGGVRLAAVDAGAAALGLRPGQTLAEARALVPDLRTDEHDPAADAQALRALADWCGRYSPWVAPDGADGIALDLTGAAHLFGGETALLAELHRRLRRFGLTARAAIADTLAAAWAVARFGDAAVVAPGATRAALKPLPVAALRLEAETVAALAQVGLRRIGDLAGLPRAALARRFGPALLQRLDQATGAVAEPFTPLAPAAPWRTRIGFAEPIGTRPDLDAALTRLLAGLCALLAREQRGARALTLACSRVDGSVQHLAIGTARPSRDAAHLFRLFRDRLDAVAPGFGIEEMILAATATDALAPEQAALGSPDARTDAAPCALAELVDRLSVRLGPERVFRLAAVDSHLPERTSAPAPALAGGDAGWPAQPRPVRLLPDPEPVEATTEDDAPPAEFRWRRVAHRIVRAEGPERIAPDWWRDGAAGTRDYWRVEDDAGRRFWLYRAGAGAAARWYLHGLGA